MKPFWRWHSKIFVAACAATFFLFIWHHFWWDWLIPFAVGALLMWHTHRLVRCPKCSRRLRARVVEERHTTDSWRYLYDCSNCRITWDSQYVVDGSAN
jgi:formate dehydrogenase maturation protein FdhE